jgi:hypothetical protein
MEKRTGWISVDRRLILLSMLTIPSSILSRLQKIWANNNRNYESGLPTKINWQELSEDELENICFLLLLAAHPLLIAETINKEKTLESVNYPLKTFVILLLQHQLLGIGIQ